MKGQFKVHKDAKRQAAGVAHWRVDGKIGNQRVREFFETEVLAQEKCRIRNIELQNLGHEAASVPSSLRIEAMACVAKLHPLGASLTEAVAFFLKHRDIRAKSITVAKAWDLYKAHQTRRTQAQEISPRTLETVRKVCSDFAQDFGQEQICDITSQRISQWLNTLPYATASKNTYRLNTSGLFTHAVDCGWIQEHPIKDKKVKGFRSRSYKRPDIFSVEVAAKLLEVADERAVAPIAIGLFAGLRPSEVHRLRWENVHAGEIDVLAEKSKTARYRFVKFGDNLAQWLAPYRKTSGPVFEGSLADMTQLISAAGKAAGLAAWPKDALRHSYGSYQYALTDDAPGTAARLGHTSEYMLFKHYRNRVSNEAARAYFQIRPLAAQEAEKVQDLLAAA